MPFSIIEGDITKLEADAIVNAANETLLGGGGVDGAIHRAAGPGLLAECMTLGGCRTGRAKITGGYDLPARHVIHTVGPVWNGGDCGERELLASCYRSSLRLALENGCRTVAFPLISAGVYGYPKEAARRVAEETIREFLDALPETDEMHVMLVIYDRADCPLDESLRAALDQFMQTGGRELHPAFPDAGAFANAWTAANSLREGAVRHQSAWIARSSRSMKAPAGKDSCRLDREDLLTKEDSACLSMNVPPSLHADARESCCGAAPGLDDVLGSVGEGFPAMLLRKIREKGMTEPQCYKLANIDRKLFSKIRSDPGYQPRKTTAIAFALALRLTLDETRELLEKAGFALSHSSKADLIVEYFIRNSEWDVFRINDVLFAYGQPLLGVA